MVHDDSHSTLRARAVNSSRRSGFVGMTDHRLNRLIVASRAPWKFSNMRDSASFIGIKYQYKQEIHGIIPMHALDAIDRRILTELQTDSRITMAELADKVGLSVSPCHRRVRLLEER